MGFRFWVLIGISLIPSSHVLGLGFMIHEHGATSTGMANARSASSDDVNAVFYNPAALTELPGFQFQLGLTGIVPLLSYEANNQLPPRTYTRYQDGEVTVNDGLHDTDAKIVGFSPIHLYASYRIDDWGIAVGVGLNNPYGLGTFWPGDWDGRFIGTDLGLNTFITQTTIAVDIAKLAGFKNNFKLSVAGGYNFIYGTAKLVRRIDLRFVEQMTPIRDPEGEMRMSGDGVAHGWNVALYAELPGTVSFGAALRSAATLPFSGTARFSFNSAGHQAIQALGLVFPESTTGDLSFNLPWSLNFGFAYLGIERLKLAMDLWVTFFSNYKELKMDFSCGQDDPVCEPSKLPAEKKDWGTAYQASFGAEYYVLDFLALRAGYGYGTTPIPDETMDPTLPDNNRHLFCVGFGFKGNIWKVDLGYMLFVANPRDKQNYVGHIPSDQLQEGEYYDPNPRGRANGTYKTIAHLLGLSYSMWF